MKKWYFNPTFPKAIIDTIMSYSQRRIPSCVPKCLHLYKIWSTDYAPWTYIESESAHRGISVYVAEKYIAVAWIRDYPPGGGDRTIDSEYYWDEIESDRVAKMHAILDKLGAIKN
jgi:hypothetical protein